MWHLLSEVGSVQVIVTVVVVSLAVKWWYSLNSKLPRGPQGLPLVGYLPFLGKKPAVKLLKLGQKYGSIFGIYMGSEYTLILNDHKVIKEAFGKPEFLGRPRSFLSRYIPQSFGFMTGNEWVEQRRFTLQALRNLGMNRSHYTLKIKEEIGYLIDMLKDKKGEAFDVKTVLTPSMSNNIISLITGRRLAYNDPDRERLDAALLSINHLLGLTALLLLMPWLASILNMVGFFQIEELLKHFRVIQDYINKQLEEHKVSRDPDNPRDYIDFYLEEMNKQEHSANTTFTATTLAGNTQFLFGAGSNTVRSTVLWAILTLAKFPIVQDKVRKEIKEVVGDRDIEWDDHVNCVYTEAVLYEVQRWKTIAPLGVVRRTTEEATLQGYTIPKGTLVLANLFAAHYDKSYWKDPLVFCPQRFLNEQGTRLVKHEAYMPFSVGRRSCPGEGLGTMELFLYVTTIVQRFCIELDQHNHPATFNGSAGINYDPKDTIFKFIPLSDH